MDFLMDLHTHTAFSPDSNAPAPEMCVRAHALGLSAYAITDHCEVNCWYEKSHYTPEQLVGFSEQYADLYAFDYARSYEQSVAEITRLKAEYAGKLNLLCGVELGQATADLEVSERIAADPRLDLIIGSLHQLAGEDDFAFIDYFRMTQAEIQALAGRYFNTLLEICRWGKFDVLGHLTYILRYIEGKYHLHVELSAFRDVIAECFTVLIGKGKGIEINTSGLRQSYGKTFPTLEYVRLYRDLGGEILTLGSDAHRPEDLATGIAEGTELARTAGFSHVTLFEKHQPHFIKI